MTHRTAVFMALVIAGTFWILGFLDSQLFFVHLYESFIYLAIAVLLLRFRDRWAWMLGIVGPAAWLLVILIPAIWALVSLSIGTPSGIPERMSFVFRLQRPTLAAVIAEAITLALSAWMILFSIAQWRTEPVSRMQARSTFATCSVAVAIYYFVLIVWLLRWKLGAA